MHIHQQKTFRHWGTPVDLSGTAMSMSEKKKTFLRHLVLETLFSTLTSLGNLAWLRGAKRWARDWWNGEGDHIWTQLPGKGNIIWTNMPAGWKISFPGVYENQIWNKNQVYISNNNLKTIQKVIDCDRCKCRVSLVFELSSSWRTTLPQDLVNNRLRWQYE